MSYAASEYPLTHHHQAPTTNDKDGPSSEAHPAQNMYPNYPPIESAAALNGLPHNHDPLGQSSRPPGSIAGNGVKRSREDEDAEDAAEWESKLFGDVPDTKRRKFILVEDLQRHQRVRVKVSLNNVRMEEIPDSFRKSNAVFPRSYFDMTMQSPPASPRGTGFFKEDAPDSGDGRLFDGSMELRVRSLDGDVTVPAPRPTKSKRTKEIILNELAVRMCWPQARAFQGKPLFLQRSRKFGIH